MFTGLRQMVQEAETEGGTFAGVGHPWQAREILAQLRGYASQQVQSLLLLAAGALRKIRYFTG